MNHQNASLHPALYHVCVLVFIVVDSAQIYLGQFFTTQPATRAISCRRVSVRPSVRPSYTRRHCVKTAERIIGTPHDSPGTVDFGEIRRVTPNGAPRQIVPEMGVITSRDPFQIFRLPKISLGRLMLKTSNSVHWLTMCSISLRIDNSPSSGRGHGHVTSSYFGK